MSTEYASDSENAEMRRRAAWLLGMLILVAALLVVIMLTVFKTSGGKGVAGPTNSIANTPTSSSSSPTAPTSEPSSPTSDSSQGSTAQNPLNSPPESGDGSGAASCTTGKTCVLDGDVGDAISAVNDYRTSHGKPAATGTVSSAAQACALSKGDDCSGSWAQTQLSSHNGTAAVRKILSRGHVLSDYTAFEVGWAYDPGEKQYFFALIRTG